jgi:hypothetical protein
LRRLAPSGRCTGVDRLGSTAELVTRRVEEGPPGAPTFGRHVDGANRITRDNPDLFGTLTAVTLNPDELAETLWRLYGERESAEAVVNALGV